MTYLGDLYIARRAFLINTLRVEEPGGESPLLFSELPEREGTSRRPGFRQIMFSETRYLDSFVIYCH